MPERLMVAALVRNWWMMGIRGGVAIAFGLSLLLWPNVTLGYAVLLFGIYALVDGVWAVAAALRASRWPLEGWPVGLEGFVSIVLGGLALFWPFVPSGFQHLIAAWGILTGLLEVLAATRLPSEAAGHWFIGTGGVSSLFLAVFILILPHADTARAFQAIGVYALVFGLALFLAALRFRQIHERMRQAGSGISPEPAGREGRRRQ
jgi:uncharacterized membrane protein HdeD (DUF308 family)